MKDFIYYRIRDTGYDGDYTKAGLIWFLKLDKLIIYRS